MSFSTLIFVLVPFLFGGRNFTEALSECCGKCVGSAYCTACKNCSACKHCNSGGTCGVCSSGSSRSSRYEYRERPSYSTYSISPTPTKEEKKTPLQYFVNTTQLNIRSGPGKNYPVIGKLKFGQPVKIEKQYSKGWCLISYAGSSGVTLVGYVATSYLRYLAK